MSVLLREGASDWRLGSIFVATMPSLLQTYIYSSFETGIVATKIPVCSRHRSRVLHLRGSWSLLLHLQVSLVWVTSGVFPSRVDVFIRYNIGLF